MSSILVVEDDITLRELLFELFSETYHCSSAETAEQALCFLDSKHFDLVLTDISMPGMSGLELLGHIRQRWPETVVIIVSGIRDKEYAEGLVRMGAFDYLVKPFELVDVYQAVARAIEQHGQASAGLQEVERPAPEGGEKEGEPAEVFSSIQLDKVFSLSELLELVQRSRMNGYVRLCWDESTVEEADRTGRFKDAAGSFDESLRCGSGTIYLSEGFIVDAAIAESEANPYWRDAEQSLVTLVRLSTWVRVGVRAWGYSTPEMTRRHKLSVSDNSGKLFNIITADEEAYTDFEGQAAPGEAQEERAPTGVAY
jgi:DNA-binding response OmpR family regulator